MSNEYSQLCGAIGCLKNAGVELPYADIKETMKDLGRTFYNEDMSICPLTLSLVRDLHKFYRGLCLQKGLIQIGYLFGKDDIAII